MRIRIIRDFIRLESSAGIILFSAAVLALAIDNSSLSYYYHLLLSTKLGVHFGPLQLSKSLLMWIDDGLMALFFLLVGLEIKREMLDGELSSWNKALLPVIAAVGGMLIPALIYIYINWGNSVDLRGWAIPTATDIAFALGILSLLGSRIPVSLKIFLTALAIFDDIGAVAIIAGFYTHNISYNMLFAALILILVLFIFNRINITSRTPYVLVGLLLWLCVLKSGVHATLAGVIIAMMIPMRDKKKPENSPLKDMEHALHPWVAFLILPVFAFANSGVSFAGMSFTDLLKPVPLGIALGLFFGKQIGIWLACFLAIKLRLVKKPHGVTWGGLYGVSLIAGVGFTMSLFIGGLAFAHSDPNYAAYVRMGVLSGSLLSGLCGYFILRICYKPSKQLVKVPA